MAVVYQENMGLYEKLRILSDSAKYDGMYFERCFPQGGGFDGGEYRGMWDMPQLFSGWALYFPVKNIVDKRVYLRL